MAQKYRLSEKALLRICIYFVLATLTNDPIMCEIHRKFNSQILYSALYVHGENTSLQIIRSY